MPPPKFLPVEERTRKALALLGPGARKTQVHFTIVFVERAKQGRHGKLPRTQREKDLVKRAASALRKFRATVALPDFPSGARDAILGDEVIYLKKDGQLRGWFVRQQRLLDEGAKADTRRNPSFGAAKRQAAKQAAFLLRRQKLPVTATRAPKRSLLLRLAAILYGVENANLYRQCRPIAKRERSTRA